MNRIDFEEEAHSERGNYSSEGEDEEVESCNLKSSESSSDEDDVPAEEQNPSSLISEQRVSSIVISSNTAQSDSKKKYSSYLKSFLSRKRECTAPLPPDLGPLRDDYLIEFQMIAKASATTIEREDDHSEDDLPPRNSLQVGITVNEADMSASESDDESDDSTLRSNDVGGIPIKLYNVPYTMSGFEISRVFEKARLKVLDIIVDMDSKRNVSLGTASARLPADVDLVEVSEKIADLDFKGRRLRLECADCEGFKSKNSGGGADKGRYFTSAVDITKKCRTCGIVGHNESACKSEAPLQPCHLCARLGHEASE